MAVDLGTGDGRAVLALAAARPDVLAVGIDADPTRMRDASRRRTAALFVVAAAEAPPAELAGRASALTVHFPWGSLLRGIAGEDGRALAGAAALLAPGAPLRAVVSVTPRDAAAAGTLLGDRAALARAYEAAGLQLTGLRAATAAEVAATRSSWAKRIGAGRTRPATLLEARRHRPAAD